VYVNRHTEKKRINILVAKRQGKRVPGKSKHRWEDNTETHLKRTGCHRVNSFHVTLERRKWRAIVSTVMKTACDFHKT
jgi:hypothetical protein